MSFLSCGRGFDGRGCGCLGEYSWSRATQDPSVARALVRGGVDGQAPHGLTGRILTDLVIASQPRS